MDKEKVIEILDYYKEIDGEIALFRRTLNDYENQYYNTMGAIVSDGQPHGKNHVSNIVEERAMIIPDYVRKDIDRYKTRIDTLQKLKSQILQEVSRLKLKEKTVIFDFYIYGMKWEQVAERIHYSDRQCKNIRDVAVEKLAVRFENNASIKGFQKII